MIPFMKFPRLLAVAVVVLSALASVVAHAQLWAPIQDSIRMNRIGAMGDTVPANSFWAAYSFENTYDDSGNVFFFFTEASVNGQRIELANWAPFQFIKDSTAEALSGISRTRPFTVTGGDVVRYYREFAWQNPNDFPALQQPDNFYSDDTLEYVIRLRKASNNMPLAVLDSVGVLAQSPAGSPTFYGTGLAMGVTQYTIPAAITTNTDVYLSIDVRAKGSGQYYTCRSDQVTGPLSEAVMNPMFSEYFLELIGVSPKQIAESMEELQQRKAELQGGTGSLSVIPNPATSGTVRVIASSPSSTARRTLLVFTMDGRIVYSYSTASERSEVEVNIAEAGTYYVVYTVGEEVVAMDLLNVVR